MYLVNFITITLLIICLILAISISGGSNSYENKNNVHHNIKSINKKESPSILSSSSNRQKQKPTINSDTIISRNTWEYKISIILRATYLFMIYFPVIITSGLAFISESFREVIWFNMLSTTIAKSGAVSFIIYINVIVCFILIF